MQTTPSSSIGAGLALLLALGLSACGGGGGSTPPVGPVNTDVKALAASQPGELLAYVKTKLADRQLQRSLVPDAIFLTGVPIELAVSPAAAASPDAARSGTTVQEAGVDEDDLIKTDGNVRSRKSRVLSTKNAVRFQRFTLSLSDQIQFVAVISGCGSGLS